MKRYLLSLPAAAVAFAGSLAFAAPGLADPPVGGRPPNFFGSFVSSLTPQFVTTPSPGDFGAGVSQQGQTGTRDDFVQAFNEPLVNWGSTA